MAAAVVAGSGKGANGEGASQRLMLTPALKSHLFINHPVELSAYLVDQTDNPISTNLPLSVSLVYADDNSRVKATGAMAVEVSRETPATITAMGMCKLKLKICEVSMSHGNKAFRLRVAPLKKSVAIAPVLSDPFTVIRAKLQVLSALPDKWYKDEGGRDKCMEVHVKLMNATDAPITTRNVPLSVTLEYEEGLQVTKQAILKIASDSQLRIDSTGSALIRARIEDVSKNHQGQKFRLRVAPNVAEEPLTNDIAADVTSCVTVRSKRNKRQRGGTKRGRGGAAAAGAVAGPRAGINDSMARSLVQLTQESGEPATTAEALNKVIQWSNMTVHALQSLEWQTVGYELKPDGTNDRKRPILRCPGCWTYADTLTLPNKQHTDQCVLSNALQAYATDALRGLHLLVKEIHGEEVYKRAKAAAGKTEAAAAPAPAASTRPAKKQRVGSVASHHSVHMGANVGAPVATSTGMALGRSSSDGLSLLAASTGGLLGSDDEDETVTGGLAKPGLLRGLSDVVSAQPRLETGISLGMAPPGFSRMATSEWLDQLGDDVMNTTQDPAESQVHWLVAEGVAIGGAGAGAGYPAFGADSSLLGFYVMSEAQPGQPNQVRFVPLQVLPDLPPASVAHAAKRLQDLRAANDTTQLKCITNFGSIAVMAEQIMFHMWGKRA